MLRTATAALLMGLACACAAHELPDNRLTLVLRERTHLSLSFRVDLPAALHRELMPRASYTEFVLAHAAMGTPELQQQLQRARSRFEAGTRVAGADGKALPLTQWRWPDLEPVRKALQAAAMQAVVAPAEHGHEAPLEVRAECLVPVDAGPLSVQLPAAFGPVLIVSYRPHQTWKQPGAPPVRVAF